MSHHGTAVGHKHGTTRSSHWHTVERRHKAMEPECRACRPGVSRNYGLQVHHQMPFHFCVLLGRPDLELDHRNLITLCQKDDDQHGENHHLLIGHLDSWESSNVHVLADASVTFHGGTDAQIRENAHWQQRIKGRLKTWAHMSEADKHEMRAMVDAWFPRVARL